MQSDVFKALFIFIVCVSVGLYICMSTMCMPHALRAIGSLGNELQMAVSCHVGVGNKRLVLCKSGMLLTIEPSL